jgi:putative hydrolase of HD superfamily
MRRKSGDCELSIAGKADERAIGPELGFWLRAMNLKRLYRQGWLKRDVPEELCESVADHSFMTALMAASLAGRPPYQDVDPAKAVLMALTHELCEVYAGDITPADGVGPEEKRKLEAESLKRALGASSLAPGLEALWEEFEEGESPEARLVKQIDRLEMGLQAAVYEAEGQGRMEEFHASADRAVKDGLLRAMLASLDAASSKANTKA